jgi:hypothetical protein
VRQQQDAEATVPSAQFLPPSSPSTPTYATSPVVTECSLEPPLDPVPMGSKQLIILSNDENDEASESRRRNSECYTGSNSQILTELLIIACSTVPVGRK